MILALVVGLAACIPSGVRAQAPVFVAAWEDIRGPAGIDVDADGNVFLMETVYSLVRKFSPDGAPLLSWGGNGTAPGQFNLTFDLALDPSGSVYVADGNGRIQKFSHEGVFLLEWGPRPGTGDGQFVRPKAIAVGEGGVVYVLDSCVEKFTGDGVFLQRWGIFSEDNGLDQPSDMAVDATGNLYVTDSGNHRVVKYSSSGDFLMQFGTFGVGPGQFDRPWGIAIDKSGDIYVTDPFMNRVEKFTATGEFLTQWGTFGNGNGQFFYARGIAADAVGNVYVTDFSANRVQKFAYLPVPTTRTSWGRVKALFR
jgi:DNA-binding beta-propeller fold protein YncE